MTYRLLNPTSEETATEVVAAPRIATLKGMTVGIISNGKEGTKGFFSHLEHMLREEIGVSEVRLCQKSNYSAPAEQTIMEEARGWDLAITGIGD